MLAYFTFPLDENEPYQKVEYGKTYVFEAPIFMGSTGTGHLYLQAVCSASATVETTVSNIAEGQVWTDAEAERHGWPIIAKDAQYLPCKDVPNFTLEPGKVYQFNPNNAIISYRRIRFTITIGAKPADAKSDYAALRIEVSVR